MDLIIPNWNAPSHVKAVSSTRQGGMSTNAYHGLNLGIHVEDDPIVVLQNRSLLTKAAGFPSDPVWLNQTHSVKVAELGGPTSKALDADASVTSVKGVVCCVMTADCLPVLLTDIEGSKVAAVHAGWRGLADGILENAVKAFDKPVIAWLGPAIGAQAFEVGQDVFQQFVQHSPQAEEAFISKSNQKYVADMNLLATQRLNAVGVEQVFCSDMCTYSDPAKFYSYRRDGITGRQASFIWIDD
ncbi:peptidoglycan editing factor PgeF [Vibrio sp. 99-8-1]|nr:peptidoglycan editing factor PgeF [Vibrio sp. 99-8-1]